MTHAQEAGTRNYSGNMHFSPDTFEADTPTPKTRNLRYLGKCPTPDVEHTGLVRITCVKS